jgi:WhiB family transcriptional regulator, redox-sensing transcriptional regulator
MARRPAANCTDQDPDLFFPVGTSGPALLQIEAAKMVCVGCPIKEECLEDAPDYGVWGGYSEDERREMRRKGHGQGANYTSTSGFNGHSRLVDALASKA